MHSNMPSVADSTVPMVDGSTKWLRASICMSSPATAMALPVYDKGSDYDEWIESFDGKVTYLVLLGATREKIAECARKHGFENIIFVETMEEAVKVCAEKANPGEAVLLSPACASWGMFDNYEQRGRIFKELVRKL